MNARIDRLLDDALALAPDERSALVLALLDSLAGESEIAASEVWADEIRQRRKALLAGTTQALHWTEARRRLSTL